ncbi:MAG: aspartate--tRNA ligase [Nitrospinota bacterium]
MQQHFKRTHHCNELNVLDINKEVTLAGWVHRWRDHGGVVFIDLRDREGITQIVFNPDLFKEAHELAQGLRNEYVVLVNGKVAGRPEGTVNPSLPTGGVEVIVSKLTILNESKPLPFNITDGEEVSEMLRLKYRYLDLRRPEIKKNLVLRHKVSKCIRDFLDGKGFFEIETPILTKSTPEGARDYLVPSRVNNGAFFALPQSPQLFKQVLMIAGFEKYFQITRCFRDEDLRADRQPEFTQVDLELSFVERDEIFSLVDELMGKVFWIGMNQVPSTLFPVLSYAEAMERFGTDKPDLRFGMELKNISLVAAKCSFKVFGDATSKGGEVRGFNAKGCAGYSRKDMDDLTDEVKIYGAKGLAWFKVGENGLESPIAKFFSAEQLETIVTTLEGEPGDLLMFVADKTKVVSAALSHLRLLLGKRLNLIDNSKLEFVWVTDFPLFEWDEDEKRFNAMHHPFTAPLDEDIELFETDPEKMRAKAYDLVLNGSEIGGGSIRIFNADTQKRMFNVLGISDEEAREKFGFFLDALEYGTPPHGGIAFGLDRIMAIITGAASIRDVIAFPKTQKAVCSMTNAPSNVSRKQLRELGIKLNKPVADKESK